MARSRVIALDSLQQFTAINVLSDPGAIGGPVVIPNCVQVVINWTQASGKTAHNVLYGRAAGVPSPTPSQAQAIFSAMTTGAAWTAAAALISNNTGLTGVSLRSVHLEGQPLVNSTGAAVVGTAAGAPLPSENSICVTLRTALAGPSNRGRFFVPNLTVDSLATGNVISAAAVTAFTNWANGFIAILSGQGLTWVIGQQARQQYTGSTGTVHPAKPATSTPVTQALVRDNHWDSQRRRGLK